MTLDLSRLSTVEGLEDLRDPSGRQLFAASTVRGWIYRNEGGFRDRCVIVIGRCRYVDLDRLAEFLESRIGARAPARRREGERAARGSALPARSAALDAALKAAIEEARRRERKEMGLTEPEERRRR